MSPLGPGSAAMERSETDWEKLLALAVTATMPQAAPSATAPISPPSVAPRRVVSLLGAASETVVRLGRADVLVGRSHECDWPPSILRLPMVSAAKIDTHADSRTIDSAVRAFADKKEPVYAIEAATLDRLAPDLVIVQARPPPRRATSSCRSHPPAPPLLCRTTAACAPSRQTT